MIGKLHVDANNSLHILWKNGFDELLEEKQQSHWINSYDVHKAGLSIGVKVIFNQNQNSWELSYDWHEILLGEVEGLRVIQ